jgi:hypothetical protein
MERERKREKERERERERESPFLLNHHLAYTGEEKRERKSRHTGKKVESSIQQHGINITWVTTITILLFCSFSSPFLPSFSNSSFLPSLSLSLPASPLRSTFAHSPYVLFFSLSLSLSHSLSLSNLVCRGAMLRRDLTREPTAARLIAF